MALESPGQFSIESGIGIGDVNGDGFADIALNVLLDDDPKRLTGLVIFGRPGLLGRQRIDSGFPGILRMRRRNDKAVDPAVFSYVGDVNRDGYADVWICVPLYPASETQSTGMGFLLYGGSSLPNEVFLEDIGHSVPGLAILSSEQSDVAVGLRAASLEDFDGDKKPDFAVSASRSSNLRGEVEAGVVLIISNVLTLMGTVDLAGIGKRINGTRIYGITREALSSPRIGNLGYKVISLGDFDGDGLSDLLAFAKELEPSQLYLIRGRPDLPPVIDLYERESFENISVFQAPLDGRFLGAMSALGDINGDGFDDALIGLHRGCCPGPGPAKDGAAYIFYGANNFPNFIDLALIDPTTLDPALWRVVHPDHPYASFTAQVAGAGDLNQDGVPDFLIGSPGASINGSTSAGTVYAIYGQRDLPQELILKNGFNGIQIVGETAYSRLGQDLSPAGDFNGDAFLDILALAPNYATQGVARAYIVYGTGNGPPPLTVYSSIPASGSVRGGTNVILRGSGFNGSSLVRFADQTAQIVKKLSTSELEVVTPPRSIPGTVDVTVTLEGVTRHLPGGFEYTPILPSFDLTNLGTQGFTLDGEVAATRKLFTAPAVSGISFGDLTGDGIDDLIVEATEPKSWKVFVVPGGPDLPPALQAYEPSPFVTSITSSELRSVSGATVSVIGDVNGGGLDDLAIGTSDGLAYLFFPDADGLPPGELFIEELVENGLAAQLHRSSEAPSGAMMVLVAVGDLTGDSIDDFAIGFRGASLNAQDSPIPGPDGGEILFVKGRTSWPSAIDLSEPGAIWARIHGARSGQGFAERLQQVGDVNGDGFPDLLADSAAAGDMASAFLLFTRGDLPARANVEEFVEAGGGVRFNIRDGFSNFNWFNVAAAGDVNADHYADLLLGVEGGGGSFQGVTYLIYGSPSLKTFIDIEETPTVPDGIVRIVGEGSMEQSGRPGPAGDFNADGYADFIIGAPGFQEFGEEPGNVFIVFGHEDLPPQIDLKRLGARGLKVNGRNILGGAGFFAGPSGDFNGDGLSDVAFSENAIRDGDRAHIYVLFNAFGEAKFTRGDANFDGEVNISDAIFTLTFLFLGGAGPLCDDAVDSDDSGAIDITDAIRVLNHLFLGTATLPAPYPEEGKDLTPDSLKCLGF